MTGLDFSRQLTSDLVDAMIDGLDGENGTYLAPTVGAVVQPCRLLINRAVQSVGQMGPTSVGQTQIQVVRADLSAPPVEGGTVTVGAESWKLDARIVDDGTLSTWAVTRART